MVSSLYGYLIVSSLQKKPRRKGLCFTVRITNGSPASREATREQTKKKLGYKMMSRELRTPTHNATLTVCLCKVGYSCIPLKSAATSLRTIRDVKVVLMVKMENDTVSGVLRRSECCCVCSCDWWNRCVSSGIVFPPTGPQRAAAVSEWEEKWFYMSATVLGYPLSHSLVQRRKCFFFFFFDLIFGTLDWHTFSHTFHHETVNGEVSG